MDLSSSKKILAVALASSALLAGCHDDDDAPVTPVETVELSGVAVKGAMVDADVVACVFNSACADATSLAQAQAATGFLDNTTTIEGGAYSLTLDVTNDPVVIKLFSNVNTRQECDYEDCVDEPGNVGVGLTFSTVAFVESSNTPISAPVNALTTVATTTLLDGLDEDGEAAFAGATEASITAALATASSNALAALGVDSSANIFTTDVSTANTAELTGASADESALSVVNATIGALATGDETLGEAVARVSSAASTFVTTVQSGGTVDTTAVAEIATALAAEVADTAADAGVDAPATEEVDETAVADLPTLVEDTTGASSGGDSTGA
jgi:hypothetical protein